MVMCEMVRLQFQDSVYLLTCLEISQIFVSCSYYYGDTRDKWNTLVIISSLIFVFCSYYYGDTRDKWNTLVIILSLIFVFCSYYYGDTRDQIEHIGKNIIPDIF